MKNNFIYIFNFYYKLLLLGKTYSLVDFFNSKLKKLKFDKMKGGWFIGDFEPSAYRTKDFEVAYTQHKKNSPWPKHYHKKATEITLIIKGKLKINNEIFSKGDILTVNPNEIVDPTFLEDVEFVVVKTISDVNDKYILKK